MKQDIRASDVYREAEAIYRSARRPGSGLLSDAADVSASATCAVFAGSLVESLDGAVATRIVVTELATGDTRIMTFGPNTDRSPRFSPDGTQIAFLSDRVRPGDFQLYLLDPSSGVARATPAVPGWVEYLHWSPDGTRILLGVAGHGADVAGAQGAVTSARALESLPAWMPSVQNDSAEFQWRRAWIYELSADEVREAGPAEQNIWEANWCGNHALVAIASPGPQESRWYRARLHLIHIASGLSREIHASPDQMGLAAGNPSGNKIAVVDALCSDRWIVAGDLRIVDTASGESASVDTRGVDITCLEWRSEHRLLLAGHRGLESVVGIYDVVRDAFTETWASNEVTSSGGYLSVSGLGDGGDCVFVGEGFRRAPEIALVRGGRYGAIRSFDLDGGRYASEIRAVEAVSWRATDGQEIQGLLLRPHGTGPRPVVMYLHGGPVGHWRPFWLGRWSAAILMLLRRGYAIFLPNPRGSSGYGQEFARRVLGDMGGADAADCLAGLDHLIACGIADPTRLGVIGGSYGGFMASWLTTQDSRFAAAVSVSPVTNFVTAHLLSNIPDFMSLFLRDSYDDPGGQYFARSPVMHARQVRTPMLNICGALDRCTPPQEAMQFHNALLVNGTPSSLVIYPQEGHGVRTWPALIDFAARVVHWFQVHMAASAASAPPT